QANNSEIEAWWAGAYTAIYGCNAILEGLTTSPLPEKVQDPMKGEALFLRAFLHFYLTNLYGDIPYVTTTDYTVNAKIKKITEEKVYDNLIADLERAEQLLSDTDVGQDIYATKAAVNTLLARVFLYKN